jgi:hypothetical protein
LERFGFFSPVGDRGSKAELGHNIADFLIIVALIQAQTWWLLDRGLRARHDPPFERARGEIR